MIVEDIVELEIVGVFDAGVPNQERIAIVAKEEVNVGQYGLMLGVRANNGQAFPIKDNLLWFGDAVLNPGDLLFVYTGAGEPRVSQLPNNSVSMISIHWGKENVIFSAPELVPILFRVDAVDIPQIKNALTTTN